MDVEGTIEWADWLRLALFFAALWFSFRVGRVYEGMVRDMQQERSP